MKIRGKLSLVVQMKEEILRLIGCSKTGRHNKSLRH
jgi:hypothetical protein